ncbi:LHPP [Mytilus coruscus]|uniref:Phospholysine phosphohistidine inorganic pyrophosphate phosphatase n=1 Tax=Mytilus coruscus TaxID=42192 RepID=A0A6J8DII0_MYTCO|nr:LHPP [Mytilus coruscus]
MSWCKNVKGVLLDITGVLFESGASEPIKGSIEAIKRLKDSKIPVRFCTNETTKTRQKLLQKLHSIGFSMKEDDVFPPIPACCQILKSRGLRPHLVVNPDALSDFCEINQENPNCVVLGDATDNFSYQNLNKAFQLLMSLETPVLFALGGGKYYKEGSDLILDVGPFAKALEYACDVEAEIVGKPSKSFFGAVLQDLGQPAESVVMIGDDIVNDVGGAQSCGMRGVQVRTGKYRPSDENHPTVKADGYVDNLAHAIDLILQS